MFNFFKNLFKKTPDKVVESPKVENPQSPSNDGIIIKLEAEVVEPTKKKPVTKKPVAKVKKSSPAVETTKKVVKKTTVNNKSTTKKGNL